MLVLRIHRQLLLLRSFDIPVLLQAPLPTVQAPIGSKGGGCGGGATEAPFPPAVLGGLHLRDDVAIPVNPL